MAQRIFTNIAPLQVILSYSRVCKNSSGIAYGADVTINTVQPQTGHDTADVNKILPRAYHMDGRKIYMVRTWVNVNAFISNPSRYNY